MKKKVRRFAHLLLTFMFLTTTMLGFSRPAPAGTAVELSTLQPGATVSFGGYTWIVLDPSTGYMLMKSDLEDFTGNTILQPFDSSSDPTWPSAFNHTDPYSIAYYLNNTFLNSLSSTDQAAIQSYPWTTGPDGHENSGTDDCKIGLISYSEYLGYTTNYYYNNYFGIISNLSASGWWWTRTPWSGYAGCVWGGLPDGELSSYNTYAYWTHAVRPALYLNPDTSISLTPGGDLSVVTGGGETGQSTVKASPTSVLADGGSASTITVTLNDANGNAISGEPVQLSPSSNSHTVITSAGGSAGSPGASASGTTNSSGQATFTVTDTVPETVTYTATDITYNTTYIPHIQVAQTAQVNFTPGTADAITAYGLGLTGETDNVNSANGTVAVTVPYGTDMTNLAATFTLSPGATAKVNGVTQVSGTTTNNFTNAVTYAVYAQDNIHEQDWTVTVTVQQPPPDLTNINPAHDLAGSSVTLSGSNFGSVAGSVYFQQAGKNWVVNGSNWSDDSAQGTVPDLSPGAVSVAVYNSVDDLTSNWLAFGVTPPKPTLSPDGGAYPGSQNVTISNVASWDTAYYTTDGTTPISGNNTPGSTAVPYSGSFTVSKSETVRAAVYDNAGGWSGVTSAPFTFASAISPTTATFDLNPSGAYYKDVPVTVTWNGNALSDIKNGSTTLTPNTDYTVASNTVTILKSYLATLSPGTTTLTFDFNAGSSATLNITVEKTSWNNLVWTLPATTSTTTTAALPVDSTGAYTGSGAPPGTSVTGSLAETGAVPATPVRLYLLKNGQPVTATDIEVFVPDPSGKWYNVASNGYGAKGGFNLSTGLAAAQGSMPLSVRIVATDTAASGKYELAVGTPGPDGISLNTVVSKSSDITLTAQSSDSTDGGGAAPALVITTTSLPPGTVGQFYNQAITTNNEGTAPYTFAVTSGSLPPGLTLDADTGVIGGTPTAAGAYTLTVTVKDKNGNSASESYTLTVGAPSLAITTTSLAAGTVSRQYSQTIATNNEGTAPYTFAVTTGSLPPGLVLEASTGVVSGTPTTAGTYAFTVTVKDANNTSAAESYTLTVGAAPTTPNVTLKDIGGSWAQGAIDKLLVMGVAMGYPDGTFRPNNPVTRAEFATMLDKALKLPPRKGHVFPDTEGMWCHGYISTAAAYGIVKGYDANHFGPNDLVTREQMTAMVVRAAKLAPVSGKLTFKDAPQIDQWAREDVLTAVKDGIVHGYPDGTFRPLNHATRAEAASVIVSLLK